MPSFQRHAPVSALLVALMVSLVPATDARADGLLYDLPKDGTWVKFDLTASQGEGGNIKTMTGTLTMSVVGTVKENDTTLRWIEFKMVSEEPSDDPAAPKRVSTAIIKALLPEEHLKKGAEPMKHFVRGWMQFDGREVREATQREFGPLPVFLAGPLSEAKELKPVEIENKLGKLECAGVRGTVSYEESPTRKATATFHEVRLHKKAPFGVVAATIQLQTQSGENPPRDRGTITFKFADTGDDAKSALPDSK